MKIIHILCHSPGPGAYLNRSKDVKPRLGSSNFEKDMEHYFRIPNQPYWAGYFSNDFHVKLSSSIQKETSEFLQECWRPYNKIDTIKSKIIDGVKHKLFPSEYSNLRYGKNDEKSPSLLENLENEINKGKVLVHLHGYHSYLIDFCRKLIIDQQGEIFLMNHLLLNSYRHSSLLI